MTTITVEDMQRDPRGWLRRVREGEKLRIMEADRAVAEISPVEAAVEDLRPFGLCAGEFSVPDDFDDPLPEDILRDFDGAGVISRAPRS